MATVNIINISHSAIVESGIVDTIGIASGLVRAILETAQMIRSVREDPRDVDLLYGLLLHANAAAASASASAPVDHGIIANIERIALGFAHNTLSKVDAARAILQAFAIAHKNDAPFMVAFHDAVASAKTCITKDAIEFARECESCACDMCAIVSAVERKSRVDGEYDPDAFDVAFDSVVDSCFASVIANYPEDARVTREVFAKFIEDESRESTFHLVKSAHEILTVMGDGRKLIEFIKIAVQHERESRALA